MGAGLVAAQVENGVRVAGDGLPAILVQLLDLGHVLDDGAGGDVAGAHGGQFAGKAGQGHRGELVQHEVDMAGQGPMVDLVGAVVEGLERLGVEQGYQKIECRVIVRDDGVQRHLLFAQGVEVHVVVVGDGLDLGQVEGGQPDGGGHEDGLGGLARGHLKDLVLPHRHAVRPDLLYGLEEQVQGRDVRQSGVKRPVPLLPHIEDGTLLHQVGQHLLCAGGEGRHIRLGRDVVVPKEGKLFPVLLKAHDLLPELGRHAGRVLPLTGLSEQIEIVDIQGQKAGILWVLLVGTVLRPGQDRRAAAHFNGRQIALDCGPDAVLREQSIFPAGDHEPLLPPQSEAQAVPVADLIAHVLHEQRQDATFSPLFGCAI